MGHKLADSTVSPVLLCFFCLLYICMLVCGLNIEGLFALVLLPAPHLHAGLCLLGVADADVWLWRYHRLRCGKLSLAPPVTPLTMPLQHNHQLVWVMLPGDHLDGSIPTVVSPTCTLSCIQ